MTISPDAVVHVLALAGTVFALCIAAYFKGNTDGFVTGYNNGYDQGLLEGDWHTEDCDCVCILSDADTWPPPPTRAGCAE